MRLQALSIVAVAACLAAVSSGAAPPEASHKVVVNASNPASSLAREEVARLFLKKTTTWASGQTVAPVDLGEDSPVRAAFSKAVLSKDVPTVKSYWQSIIFSGRGAPPPEKASEADALAFVRSNANAIGYVAGGTPLGDGVRVLTVGN